MTHIIRRQNLHVELNGTEADGLDLQRGLSVMSQHALTPAIERVLDRCAPSDGCLYIERLEIDAGVFPLERLERDLAESVAQAIEKALRGLTSSGQALPTIQSANVELRTSQYSVNEAFIYFLKTGSLPWSFRLPQARNLEQAILESWQAAAETGIDLGAIDDKCRRALVDETARRRLLRQFSSVFLETLLARLSPEGNKVMAGLLATLRSFRVPELDMKLFDRCLWDVAFVDVLEGRALAAGNLIGAAWRAVPVTAEARGILARLLESHWPEALVVVQATTAKSVLPLTPAPVLSENITTYPGGHPDAGQGIYIDNAGLVLLHPFLPQFFIALGIASEDKLLEPERAVGLLHFLTTGQPVAPEYELMLGKVLCNLPLQTAVESDPELTDLEKQEATGLLEAVIRHWDALGSTSPDGLRGTFLLRPGKISFRDDGDWLLQVESRGYDILLDQLPWGFSTIKLPWMSRMMWVEWR